MARLSDALPKTEAKPRRKHRRVRKDWVGCKCPEGTRFVNIRVTAGKFVTRRWSCIKNTSKGARYVRAVCDGETVDSLHREPDHDYEKPQKSLLVHSEKTRASRTRNIDWSKCGCPSGSEIKQTKRGPRCLKKGKFVKAVCS